MQLKKFTQKDRYGNMFSYEFNVPSMNEVPKPDHPGEPKGTDTVPAWLTPGENVINAEASRIPGVQPLLDDINDMGRAIQKKQGGPIPTYEAKGNKVGKPTGRQTIVGREIYDAGNKGFMSEQGMTIPTQEGYYNVPSIHNGIQYNEDQLERMVNDGVIPMPTSFYQDKDNAIIASIMRSRALDGQNVMGMEHTQPRYKQKGGIIGDNQINYGSKNTYTDYYGRPYQVSKLYQPINDDLVKGEVEKMKEMGLPNNQMMTALEDNLNLSSDQAVSALQPAQNSSIGGSSGSTVSQIPKYNAEGTPRSTDLVQNFMDQASDMHDSVYLGKPPKYFNEGGVTITDDIVNAMMQVESGGDVNAKSESGAIGPMQIRPSTAQNPGYGVKPIAIEDLKDPVLAKDFAKRYMQKLADRNPHLSQDEIITAYHSGLGNVLKAKSGQEKLGPRGQEYASKVNAAMGEVPMPEPRPVVFDDTPMESGFMSAQASTPNRIGDPGYIPEGEDPPLPTTDTSIGAITDKREDELFDYRNFQTSALLNNEIAIQNDLEDLNKKIEEKKAKGEEISNYEIERKKELDKRLERVRERINDNQKAIDEENKADFEKQIEKDKVFNIEREVDINADIEKKKAAAQAIADQLNAEEDIDQTVMSQPEVNEFLKRNPHLNPEDSFIDKGKKVGGVILDKSIQYFKDAFSSMFNGEELARMALTYAGSRAMGYNHGASLNYSMKNYVKRVDNNLAEAKKFALTEKARDDFTMESLKEYAKTGDIDVLIPKAKTLTVKAPAGSVYARGFGQLPTFTMSDGTTKIYHGGQYKSPNHPDLRGRVEKMDSEVHGDVAVSKRFADNAASQIKVANDQYGLKQVGGDKPSDNTVKINANDLGQQANAFYRNVLRRNAISVNDAPAYEAAVNRGIAKYLDAKVQARINKTKEPSLRAYLNAEVFVPLTGIDQGMVKNTSVKNLEAIQDMVTNNIPFPKDDPRFQTQLEKEFGYREIAFKWMVMNDKVAYGKLLKDVEARLDDKGKGWDAFSYWVSKTPESEIEDILVKAGYGK